MELWAAFVVVLVASSQLSCGMPVDSRDHLLKKWSMAAGEQSSDDLCTICLVSILFPGLLASSTAGHRYLTPRFREVGIYENRGVEC